MVPLEDKKNEILCENGIKLFSTFDRMKINLKIHCGSNLYPLVNSENSTRTDATN